MTPDIQLTKVYSTMLLTVTRNRRGCVTATITMPRPERFRIATPTFLDETVLANRDASHDEIAGGLRVENQRITEWMHEPGRNVSGSD